jgi:amidase
VHQDDIVRLGIEGLHREIASGELSAAGVTDAYLARIERFDPMLQAYSEVWPDRARNAATRLDSSLRAGEPLGVLHGIPIALKDLCDVEGHSTRAGTTALGDVPAAVNAEVVDRLEAAGAVILGKTKMTEGAFATHHPSVSAPINPWSAERWTGISSSGSGVAVAAGLAVAALGTDTGGSIRFPSAACGIVGLKPTHGRVSLRGVFPLAGSLDHIGPLARSVDDVARIFSILCGHDPNDAWSLASNPHVATPSALPASVRGMRIGVDRGFCEQGVEGEIVSTLDHALGVFRDLGAEIVEVEIPETSAAMLAWIRLAAVEAAAAHAATYPSKAAQYGIELRNLIELGLGIDARAIAEAWQARITFSRRLEACFDRVDALIAPVLPTFFAADTNLADAAANPAAAVATRFTSPFNLSGSPSLTLPAGFDRDGVPIGIQIVGAHLDEARLMVMGSAFQAATDWHSMRPSL